MGARPRVMELGGLMKFTIDLNKIDFIHHSCALSIKVFQSCLRGIREEERGKGGYDAYDELAQ